MTDQPSNSSETQAHPKPNPLEDAVWTYRGYRLRMSEFVTAMVHYYRAEIQRSNVWRQRLDTTTNWAVISTGAVLSIAFSQPTSHHAVIILNTLLVTLFCFIEARRYRYYELWSVRTRLLETDFFAAMLVPPFQPSPDWADALSGALLRPEYPISMWEAFGRRLRRNYIWLFLTLGLSWIAKFWLHPEPVASIGEIVERAAIGPASGEVVLGISLAFYIAIILIAFFTIGLTKASGEVLPHARGASAAPASVKTSKKGAWYRPHLKRQEQVLALIISERTEQLAQSLLKNLKRGVTALNGTGMYTGESRPVLMCAITISEADHLKRLVAAEDPDAFVVIAGANEVLGRGFYPLEED